ncbi:protein jag [Chloroflexota bacterium]
MEMSEQHGDLVEAAKGVLETLLSLLEIPASIECSEAEEGNTSSITLNVRGEDLGILIGRRGQTLASLQYMVKLILGHQTQMGLPIIVDIEGYKQRRYEALRILAWRIEEEVKVSKSPFSLEPMPAFERRIIHITLADSQKVTTESTGFGEGRKVVIKPIDDEFH